jgi:hypothetical protein
MLVRRINFCWGIPSTLLEILIAAMQAFFGVGIVKRWLDDKWALAGADLNPFFGHVDLHATKCLSHKLHSTFVGCHCHSISSSGIPNPALCFH